ncbi:hypothetical protein C8R44DRAFT_878188 [Mycena epipterygia]|nr:hypothetical protein C8R44DRAFT_878188 [Mycena epipterygia]
MSDALQPLCEPVPWDSFRSNYDVLERMIPYLPLLSLVSFGQVDRLSQSMVKFRFNVRARHYTVPFFPTTDDHATFFETLDRLQSWVVGSVPLAVLSVLSDPPVPDNLNLITSGRALRIWIENMSRMGFNVDSYEPCAGIYGSVGHSFVILKHSKLPDRRITLTSSTSTTIFRLFFAAPNTNHMVAMSGRELITPYAEMSSEQVATQGWSQQGWKQIQPSTPFIDSLPKLSPFPDAVELLRSTEYWYEPCGLACPGILRPATGLVGIAHWQWHMPDGPESKVVHDNRAARRFAQRNGPAVNNVLRDLGLSNAGENDPESDPAVIMDRILV